MTKLNVTPTGCCDPFDPEPWEDKKIVWKDKQFVLDQKGYQRKLKELGHLILEK